MTHTGDVAALYDELIVGRSRQPQFNGHLENPQATGEGRNPLCGDKTRVEIGVEEYHISAVRHVTRGCAICLAAADLMAERVTGLKKAEALTVAQKFSAMLVGDGSHSSSGTEETELGILTIFSPLQSHRARIRCAELPWVALKEALSHVDI
ncbi:Fe-S cluster assembly sulfur transfer protein SufU [Acetobacter thailandicus]|uniref:Fe-S cluster assembly sulfur transfer protein SufU n=1 Tax=Acetobacter thailandicus TaxID=1502842 RepID=UPI001BA54ACB|nr:SUF system NifU family Fe-S cluster assembly protein [Acetobacter thailandicus]